MAAFRTSSHCASNECVEVGQDWRKSSHSIGTECVEVASGVLVRDTTDRGGPVLTVGPAAWRRFIEEVRRL